MRERLLLTLTAMLFVGVGLGQMAEHAANNRAARTTEPPQPVIDTVTLKLPPAERVCGIEQDADVEGRKRGPLVVTKLCEEKR